MTSDAPAIGQAPVECAGDCSSATCAPLAPRATALGARGLRRGRARGRGRGRTARTWRAPGSGVDLTWEAFGIAGGARAGSRRKQFAGPRGPLAGTRSDVSGSWGPSDSSTGGAEVSRSRARRRGSRREGRRFGLGRWSRPSEMKGGHALIGRLLKPQKRPPKAPILSGRGADWAERVANRNSSTTARRSADRGTTYRPERSRDSPQASRATARALEGRRTSPTDISTGWTMWQTAGPLEQTTDGGPPGDEPRRMRLVPVEASVCTPLSSTPPPSVTAGSMQVRPELLESRSRHRDGCRFPGVVDLGGVASHLLRRVFSRGPPRPKTPRARPASKAG